MIKQVAARNIKLGFFVSTGVVLLVLSLYLIGSKHQLLSSTFKISANFYNVNGLMPGNNVRFAGIDIGTVTEVNIVNDSSVYVEMTVEEKQKPFIKKSTIASIGTDGLMGNKIVNLNYSNGNSASVEEGDVLPTLKPIETDVVFRTLKSTNDNMASISNEVKEISQKVNGSKVLSKLLADTSMNENLKQTILNLRAASSSSAEIANDLKKVMGKFKSDKTAFASLVGDTSMGSKVKSIFFSIDSTGTQLKKLTTDLNSIVDKANKGDGAVNMILNDTAFSAKINRSLKSIEAGSENFNQNMEAMKHNFLLRGYFKNQDKKLQHKREVSNW